MHRETRNTNTTKKEGGGRNKEHSYGFPGNQVETGNVVGSLLSVRTGIRNQGKVPRTSAGRGSLPPTILVPGDQGGMPVVTAEERNKHVACGQPQAAPGVPLVPVKGGASQTGQSA